MSGRLPLGAALALTLGALSAPGVARAQQEGDPLGAAAIVADVERLVTSTEGGGWYIDQAAQDEIYPALLESVCRASSDARRGALDQLRACANASGDPKLVFEQEGRRVTAHFEAALTRARMVQALERALAGAEKDCPFWETPLHGFRSRQTDHRRFTLSIETGGNIQLRRTAGSWTFGGGGLGRILPGYGLSRNFSVLGGVEFGGGAMLRPGSPETEFVVNYFPAIPFILRFRDVNWRYDLEFGPVGLFQADNTRMSYGARVGTSVGVLGLRTRNVIPWVGMVVTYEYYFEGGGRPQAHFIRGGLRAGIIWDMFE